MTRISPLAAKMVADNNINVKLIFGSGYAGKIMKKDVERVLKRKRKNCPHHCVSEPMPVNFDVSLRKTNTSILTATVDVTDLVGFAEKYSRFYDVEVDLTDFYFKATAKSLLKIADFRKSIAGESLRHVDYVNVAYLIENNNMPACIVIEDADALRVEDIHDTIVDYSMLIKRDGNLIQEEFADFCFQVSNLGMFGTEYSEPLVNNNTSGSLDFGMLKKEYKLQKDGTVKETFSVPVSLAYDSRIINCISGGLFIKSLKTLLESPVRLFID